MLRTWLTRPQTLIQVDSPYIRWLMKVHIPTLTMEFFNEYIIILGIPKSAKNIFESPRVTRSDNERLKCEKNRS